MTMPAPETLIELAVAATQQAYCPYSEFCVGAALLAKDGSIFTGVNVENASYGLTICAERSAFAAAIAAGAREFVAIAIVASGKTPAMPCGACRQVMSEFCSGDFTVYAATVNDPENPVTQNLSTLLPSAFSMNTTQLTTERPNDYT
jgi:cytidine deaminase